MWTFHFYVQIYVFIDKKTQNCIVKAMPWVQPTTLHFDHVRKVFSVSRCQKSLEDDTHDTSM